MSKSTPARVYHAQIWGQRQVKYDWLQAHDVSTSDWQHIRAYCRIVTAIGKTIAIQEEIDALYPRAESELIPLPGLR